MVLKKCRNCGAFISSDAEFCSSCANNYDYNKTILKGYFDNGMGNDSIPTISSATGVSPSLVQKYMLDNNYIDANGLEATSFASLPY
ncbi:MAG: hypothetical protein IKR04_03550 [Clostridia bacterium]|nr:hypothetical protein [Clostridia bacterium]